jgi:hypothetical protein
MIYSGEYSAVRVVVVVVVVVAAAAAEETEWLHIIE